MCGIAGYVDYKRAEAHREELRRMTEVIIHRGPDSVGYYEDSAAGLGFRRLSIIGITNGQQPMLNEDGSLVLTFNGEIYNYAGIREELREKGHVFTTDADSEVILHGFEEYGKDILARLRGMYCFVLWDIKKKCLFAARDGFGIKPFYYTGPNAEELVFGSEIKSILQHSSVKKELNEEAIYSYLSFQFSARNESFFKGIYELPPGHFLTYSLEEGVQVKEYWDPRFATNEELTLEEAVKMIEEVFEDSVKVHLTADTEVGSFLSGGIDSSYVVSTAKCPKTFTVGFSDDGYSEIAYAKELADVLGVENYSKVITPEEYWDSIPKVQYHMDEPVADPAAVALYFVSQLASQYVKVVCSGEGADELFGGYNVYQTVIANRAMDWLPKPLRSAVARVLRCIPFHFKGKEYLIRTGTPLSERYIGNAYIFREKEIDRLMVNPTGRRKTSELTAPYYERAKNLDDVQKMQYIDMKFWLRGDILRKADRMSMAHSLELRVPFLDYEVMKVAGSIPLSLKVDKHTTKKALRLAALKNTPKASTERKKLGFPVPIRVWLREEKYYNRVKEVLLRPYMTKLFKEKEMLALLDAHYTGRKDYSRKLWCLYCFGIWYADFFPEG